MNQTYTNTTRELELVRLRLQAIKQHQEQIKQETKLLEDTEQQLTFLIQEMEKQMKGLKGIEYDLFYQMMVNGHKPTKAVDKVAFDYDLDPSTIWKRYYPKVKEAINQLKL